MPAIPIDRLQAILRLMNEALPTAMVSGYERHIPMDITVCTGKDQEASRARYGRYQSFLTRLLRNNHAFYCVVTW